MRKKNSQKLVIGVLFLSILFLGFFQNLNISYAQGNNDSQSIPYTYSMLEFAEDINTKENITSLDFELPGSTWNITDMELNFTDIKEHRQLKSIEDNVTGSFKTIQKTGKNFMQSVQIILDKETTIYGVYIYCVEFLRAIPREELRVEIYNFTGTEPDESVIHISKKLNVGRSPNWYFQNFSSDPVTLPTGNYALVLNGTNIFNVTDTMYAWYYNSLSPTNPNLYTSRWDANTWEDTIQGEPFLYKLYQKTDASYDPDDINMTVLINGEQKKINNAGLPYSGNLSLSNLDFCPGTSNINIPIYTNQSLDLNFTLEYKLIVKNQFFPLGDLEVFENSNNLWTIESTFMRYYNNYSLKYEFPNSWKNVSVFIYDDVWDNITGTSDVIKDGNTLYILNDTIEDGVPWRITAKSQKIDFSLDVPEDTFGPNQILAFFVIVDSPNLFGDYTFVLDNDIPIQEHNETKSIPPIPLVDDKFDFQHTLPSNPNPGQWKAFIVWNNGTDAGLQTHIFTITGLITTSLSSGSGGGGGGSTTVTGLDPLIVLTISIIIIVAIAGSLTSYQMVKRLKRKRDLQMQKLRNKVIDSLNLNYIMISENSSGLNVFEKFFGGKEIDPSLISGFLSAIRSFGIELTGTFQQSQTIKLEFQNSKILMNEFRNFRLILIMGENPSDDFIESLNTLAHDIEGAYGDLIRDFDGSLTKFTGIGKLIERHLNVSFLYPLKVISSEATKLTPAERLVVNKAKGIMKQNNLGYIFTSFLMDDQTYEPKRIKAIFGLIEKGIFQPIRLDEQGSKPKIVSK